jgi:hypothetical protein
MTLTRRPSPFGELVTLRQATDRLSDDAVVRTTSGATVTPAADPGARG